MQNGAVSTWKILEDFLEYLPRILTNVSTLIEIFIGNNEKILRMLLKFIKARQKIYNGVVLF